ncbi:MAG: glycoside hydrolase family 2 TIM barrel-domain containing protein [Pseudonocardiaceae bacterium]
MERTPTRPNPHQPPHPPRTRPRSLTELTTRVQARDKNHPCVMLWSIANEPESDTEGAERYFEPLFELTRRLTRVLRCARPAAPSV